MQGKMRDKKGRRTREEIFSSRFYRFSLTASYLPPMPEGPNGKCLIRGILGFIDTTSFIHPENEVVRLWERGVDRPPKNKWGNCLSIRCFKCSGELRAHANHPFEIQFFLLIIRGAEFPSSLTNLQSKTPPPLQKWGLLKLQTIQPPVYPLG